MTSEDFRQVMTKRGWQKGIGDDYRNTYKAIGKEHVSVIQRRGDGSLTCRFFLDVWFDLRDAELPRVLDAFDEQKRKGEAAQ
jgi:hypothetical protein